MNPRSSKQVHRASESPGSSKPHRFKGTDVRPLRERGQATIEYLIVGVALIVIVTALSVLSGRLQEGLFVQHAADSASHAITVNTAGSAGDILLY